MQLKGKSAVITGAGRGIGKDIARRFATEGAEIIIAEIESTELQLAVIATKPASGPKTTYIGSGFFFVI